MLVSSQRSLFENKWRRAATILDRYNFPAAIGSPQIAYTWESESYSRTVVYTQIEKGGAAQHTSDMQHT